MTTWSMAIVWLDRHCLCWCESGGKDWETSVQAGSTRCFGTVCRKCLGFRGSTPVLIPTRAVLKFHRSRRCDRTGPPAFDARGAALLVVRPAGQIILRSERRPGPNQGGTAGSSCEAEGAGGEKSGEPAWGRGRCRVCLRTVESEEPAETVGSILSGAWARTNGGRSRCPQRAKSRIRAAATSAGSCPRTVVRYSNSHWARRGRAMASVRRACR